MEIKTRTRIQDYKVYIAKNGTEFSREYECREYENRLYKKIIENLHIKELEEVVPLTDGMTCDANNFYWYKVESKEDLDLLNSCYDGQVSEPKTYPNILCLEVSYYNYPNGYEVYTYELTDIKDSIVEFMEKFGYKVKFEKE